VPVTHEGWVVALSVLLAIQGSYVGLGLAAQTAAAAGTRRRMLLAGASLSLGVAVWTMHFVGMLAMKLPFALDYLVLPTLLSFLVCVLVVGVAVYAATAGALTNGRLLAGAAFMGVGIVSMHYIGMTALHASAHMTSTPLFVAMSILIAIGASWLALRLAAAGRGGRPTLLLSAVALGIAISGMHYTAMAGMRIYLHGQPAPTQPALSPDLLAIVVAVVAFLVSGLFLLILVPDRAGRGAGEAAPAPADAAVPIAAPLPPAAPPAEPAPAAVVSLEAAPPAGLPIEREGATYLLPVERVVAVRANAHYTYVFDGASTYFCPLPISSVEARLDSHRFVRVHRSHIINIDHVQAVKRAGDNGRIELKACDYVVPVSRGRLANVRSHLGLRPPAPAVLAGQ
jgi:NO-binding membrane sensor protein with MHYT domain